MRFKVFIEQFALGDIGPNFEKIFKNDSFYKQAGAYPSSDVSGSDTPPLAAQSNFVPNTDLTIPQTEKTARISVLLKHRNPIYVRLSDGTESYFTYDEFNRIQGKPEVGKLMTILFQRNPEDHSNNNSKIDKCIVRD
jgi:hypothetical protein